MPIVYPGVLLARGPWDRAEVAVNWRPDVFEPEPDATQAADRLLDELRERGSPAHDGLAAQLWRFRTSDRRLSLELQPARWSLRLLR